MQRGLLLLLVGLLACRRDPDPGSAQPPASDPAVARTPASAPAPDNSARSPLASAPEHFIPTTPEPDREYYPWIRSLSSGPMAEDSVPESDSLTNRMYRVAVLVSEIYDTVILEELTFGVEGCCATLRRVRRLDLEAFAQEFGFSGEVAGFAMDRWVSPRSFEFRFKGRRFRVTDVGRDTVRVAELDAL